VDFLKPFLENPHPALATGVAVIVLSTLSSLAIGSAITLLGLGLAALALESLQKE
jgi:hypothetical protein